MALITVRDDGTPKTKVKICFGQKQFMIDDLRVFLLLSANVFLFGFMSLILIQQNTVIGADGDISLANSYRYQVLERNDTIIIPYDIHEQLGELWIEGETNQEERAVCLNFVGNVITNVYPADVDHYESGSVHFNNFCSQASIHTHPNGIGMLSPLDAIFFYKSKNDYIGVMTAINEYSFYDMKDLQHPYQVQIVAETINGVQA